MNEFDEKHSYPHPIYIPHQTVTPLGGMVLGIIALVCFIALALVLR